MRKRPLLAAIGLVLAVLLVSPVVATASHDPSGAPLDEDFAAGFGQSLTPPLIYEFEFDALSGPSGENPTGSIRMGTSFGAVSIEGRVTCLAVRDTVATIGFINDASFSTVPRFGYAYAVDSRSPIPGQDFFDPFAGEATEPPQNCAQVAGGTSVFRGEIVVHDAQPFPTSKDQCRNDGWRNFGSTFRNEGQCVAFVQRGPKP